MLSIIKNFAGYNFISMDTTASKRILKLAYWLLKDVDKAINQYNMINDGDKVAVAISGGKDSLTLLKLLDFRRKYAPQKYTLYAVHVLGDAQGSTTKIHPELLTYLETSEIDFVVEPIDLPAGEPLPMNCHRCTWNRRKTLFQLAHRQGFDKIAIGHHADDLAVTTLLNLIFNGRVETMAPKASYFNGVFHIIRPLCFLFQKDINRFSRACVFPNLPNECTQAANSRRELVSSLIDEVEKWGKDFRVNLLRTGLRGIEDESESREDVDPTREVFQSLMDNSITEYI